MEGRTGKCPLRHPSSLSPSSSSSTSFIIDALSSGSSSTLPPTSPALTVSGPTVTSSLYLPHPSHNANLSPGTSCIIPYIIRTKIYTHPRSCFDEISWTYSSEHRSAGDVFVSTSPPRLPVSQTRYYPARLPALQCMLLRDHEHEYAPVSISIGFYFPHPNMNTRSTPTTTPTTSRVRLR